MAALLGERGRVLSSPSVLTSIENTVNFTSSTLPDASGIRKRKRPPMLEIPANPDGLPPVEEAATDLEITTSEGPGWGAFCKRGRRRKHTEDLFHVDSHKGFFGVFDGHGGRGAATYAAENLLENIMVSIEKRETLRQKEDAIEEAFLRTDIGFLKQGVGGGSCCVMALVGKEEIVISNLGDCRAVMCKGGVAEALTTDHTARNVDEQRRVQEKTKYCIVVLGELKLSFHSYYCQGGFIEDHGGAYRVQGILAVTRSFGDAHLKEFLSAKPDTILIPWSYDLDFLILASDGLWDKVGNQEVVDIILNYCDNLNKQEVKMKGFQEVNCSSDTRKCGGRPTGGALKSGHDDASRNKCGLEAKEVRKYKFGSQNASPQRISRVKRGRNQKPFSSMNTDKDTKYVCINCSPPEKIQRIMLSQRQCRESLSSESSSTIWKMTLNSPSRGSIWGAACEELSSIALDRGSSDDITIIIVDLKQFTGKLVKIFCILARDCSFA